MKPDEMKGVIFRVNGKKEVVNVANKTFSQLRAMIGTDIIEFVYLTDRTALMIDEEGLLREKPEVNVAASALAGQPLVGDAILVNLDDMDAIPYE